MAQRAETLNVEPTPQQLAPVVPLPVETEPAEEDKLSEIRDAAANAYSEAKARAMDAYSAAAQTSRDMVARAKTRLQIAREQNPLQIVAVVAAGAFLAGILLRIWRSRNE